MTTVWLVVFCDTETEQVFSSYEKAVEFICQEKLEYGVYYLASAVVDSGENPSYEGELWPQVEDC